MQRTYGALAALCCLLAVAVPGWTAEDEVPKEEPQKLSDQQLFDIYYEFIAKIKPYGIPTERGEHERTIAPEIRGWGGFSTSSGLLTEVSIGNEADILVTIDAYTGEIRQFINRKLQRKIQTKYAEEGKRKPRLSLAEAEKIARSYLFLNTEIKLEEHSVEIAYETEEPAIIKNAWRVCFQRRLGKYPFAGESIFVSYSEEYGLVYYDNSLFSEKCDVELRISREKALAIADSSLEEIRKRCKVPSGVRMEKPEAQGPWIISPAYVRSNDKRSGPKAEFRKTRPAWYVWYMGENEPWMIWIHIDAITGNIIHSGADAFYEDR